MKKVQTQKKHITLKIQRLVDDQSSSSLYIDDILGITFPYKPYPQQLKIMREIHLALKTNSNALIESPTGTGKTLCLLVGCLSYFYNTRLPSKIYYVTRTHSQINQIVNQLKKTSYRCKVTIIGSRQIMCINNSLRLVKGKALDRKCEQYCSKGMCRYNSSQKQLDLPILNLQQLKELGSKQVFCPYYYSRQRQQQSELVILPYNYFLSYNLLQHNGFNMKDSVIVFDQAHNVDQVAQQGCSMSISVDLLQKIQSNLKQYTKLFEGYSENKKINKQKDMQKVYSFKKIISNLYLALKDIQPQIFKNFKSFVLFLNQSTKAKQSMLFPHGLTVSSLKQLYQFGREISSKMKFQNCNYNNLEQLNSYIRDISAIMSESDEKLFQISISQEESHKRILFLCLNASFIFSKIAQRKPKSIILASGTLSPLNYWDTQIGLKFPIKLVGNSFITNNHLYSQITSSYQNYQFDFSYSKRTNQQQIQKLVGFINTISQVVPNGIVVAFSSYQLMQLTLQSFGPSNFKKKLYWQSKASKPDVLIREFSETAKHEGAILFMVMRGKFAQGIDFHDQLCRAMIVVGIPFPPLNDPKLEAKKRFINSLPENPINYDKWYMIQAARVVNQAIGRVIRHINDYGCVFLVDKKYQRNQIRQYLPQWLSKNLRPIFSVHGIINFMKRIKYDGTPAKSNDFLSAKKLLIVNDFQPKEQQAPTMKRQIYRRQQYSGDEMVSSKSIPQIDSLQGESCQSIPEYSMITISFPEKPFMKKKQISDIRFKRYTLDSHR